MWFMFPRETTGITVELQGYGIEALDKDGRGYFRAPDHFAGRILDIPGFEIADVTKLPSDAPEDLAKVDPIKEANSTLLTGKIQTLELENEALRASLATVKMERDELTLSLANAQAELSNWQNKENDEGVSADDLSSLVAISDRKKKS